MDTAISWACELLETSADMTPDPHLGQRVEAYVELERDVAPPPTGEELRSFVADRVAGYKVPERVFLLAELPRTGTGKLDRHRLETQVASDLAST